MHGSDTSNMSSRVMSRSRVVSRRDKPSGIWAVVGGMEINLEVLIFRNTAATLGC